MKKSFFVMVIALLLMISCKKEDTHVVAQAHTFEINSTNSSAWKYFSFATNDTVTVTDPQNSTNWDLAFQRYRVRTNGGVAGSGQGAAANSYKKGQAGFDALVSVPDTTTFINDASVDIAVQQGYATYIVNPALYSWFSLEFTQTGTQIVPTDNIYFVKSATGKYAKVWFKSYYSATNQSGYVTFEFKYQPDGSKNLQ